MASFTNLEVQFIFTRGDDIKSINDTFDCAGSSLQYAVDGRAEEMLGDLGEEEWEFDEYVITDYDTEFADPSEFSDLDDYGAYAENVEKFGEAFHLRYEDVGELTGSQFEDYYHGEWGSFEEYAEQFADDCMGFRKVSLPTLITQNSLVTFRWTTPNMRIRAE